MIATITRAQVRSIDRLAVERYGMCGLVLMENAGRNAADIIDRAYGPRGAAFLCCGPGNNGGDGCVIARHLHNRGWTVRLMITGAETKMSADTRANFMILQAMRLDIVICADENHQRARARTLHNEEVLVDALLGTGFSGSLRSPLPALLAELDTAPKRAVVAVDLPSGLDCDTGQPSDATIRADLTVTFVARKRGFSMPDAAAYVGKVEVADIGVPRRLVEEICGAVA